MSNNHNKQPQFFISEIRPPIAKADLERLAFIEERCFGNDDDKHPMYSPGLLIGDADKFRQYFKEPEGCAFYVVYREVGAQKEIVAYMVTVPPSNREKEGKALGHCISNIGVDPEYQGKGIGLALVIYFFNEVFQRENARRASSPAGGNALFSDDMSLVYLHVRVANPAESIYKACGFKRTLKREAYYKHNTIYAFETRAMLRRYKKKYVGGLNKKVLDFYTKRMKSRRCEVVPEDVFYLITGRSEKSDRPTGRLVADAYRMQATYAAVREALKKYQACLNKLPYKAYQSPEDRSFIGRVKGFLKKE